MARFLNRYAICAVAATILISAWLLTRPFPDLLPSDELQVATFDQRLVVFGDSWSDNQSQPPGKVWTDWLCSMVSVEQTQRNKSDLKPSLKPM